MAIVSVNKFEPAVSPVIVPPLVSAAPTTWVVYVVQLFGAVEPFSVMTMLFAVKVTLFEPPVLETLVYVIENVITAPGTASVAAPTPVPLITEEVLSSLTNPVYKRSIVSLDAELVLPDVALITVS